MIAKALEKRSHLEVGTLCLLSGVSRSGYYQWRKRPTSSTSSDEEEVISIFKDKRGKAGYRTIKMLFERKFGRPINHKKVRRIKRDHNLLTRIRRKSKFRAIQAKGQEHAVAPNLVQRKFLDPQLVLVDLTEMRIRGGQKSYVFAMKNALTREIVGLDVAANPSVALVTKTVRSFLEGATNSYILHSDQGTHFTSGEYRKVLQDLKMTQSMSRRGNCLDNAPIESFFGHLKDEIEYKECRSIEELRRLLKDYMNYYNYERPQWDLERKTPAEARVELGLVY